MVEEHLLQKFWFHDDFRCQFWLVETLVARKLFRSLDNLQCTAAFMQSFYLRDWQEKQESTNHSITPSINWSLDRPLSQQMHWVNPQQILQDMQCQRETSYKVNSTLASVFSSWSSPSDIALRNQSHTIIILSHAPGKCCLQKPYFTHQK